MSSGQQTSSAREQIRRAVSVRPTTELALAALVIALAAAAPAGPAAIE